MTATDPYELTDRYLADDGRVFLTGAQALARLPLEQLRADRRAGHHTAAFVSGYPGSPLAGYDGAVAAAAALAPDLPIVHRPAMNEELAASAVFGSQLAVLQPDCRYDGIVGIWYGKGPGVDRASDALRHAVLGGTAPLGGAVALAGDDPAAKSSTIPSSSAGILADLHIPVLYPGDPAEALELGRHAIALSRASGLWTALKVVSDVADATATVDLHPDAFSPVIPLVDGRPYEHLPTGQLITPNTIELEREIIEVRYELAARYASANGLNHVTANPPDAWMGIVSSGITYREVREAFARMGLVHDVDIEACGIRLLKMGMPIPFNPATIQDFARGLEEVFVIEEKRPNLESLIKNALYGHAHQPLVVGKADETGALLLPGYGSLDADAILPVLRRRLEGRVGARLGPEPPPARELIPLSVDRTPFFCSGCPHNRSTEAPDGSLVGAGIGCHTMAMGMDPDRVGEIIAVTCMGGEGMPWVGMSEFVERNHFFQNVGDGTYFHSGQLAVQGSIAAGVNVTYKLLYNGAVAMTGGQNPQGQLDVAEVAAVLLTQGVSRVLITTDDPDAYKGRSLPGGVDVWHRRRLIEAQELLASIDGVTVLIHDQACAAEQRRARKRGSIPTPDTRVVINHRICEGCGDCGQVSNCLSVQPLDTPFGRKTTIDQTTCNLDMSCLDGDCPSFMTVRTAEPGRLGRLLGRLRGPKGSVSTSRPASPADPPEDLPDPVLVVPDDEFGLRITGIGGTGVVTVAQVLGTAAMLGGYHVRGLDQTGLSQKAGPVVSDVRMSRSAPTETNRLGDAQADLLLAFDQLVAASPRGLLTADPGRTTVVGSTSGTPTGEMITHLEIEMPGPGDLGTMIAAATRPDQQHWADAQAITSELFGQTTTANIFVVGMAVQAGCLPLEPVHVEEAIALNGVAVEANISAFRWGRATIATPEAVAQRREAAQPTAPAPPPLSDSLASRLRALAVTDALDSALRLYASELVAWGGAAAARKWLDQVESVRRREREVAGDSERLTAAVAANLFKLVAYKDEYEVARLMLDAEGVAEAHDLAGSRGRVAWKLHPPILRALGMDRKVTIGSWAAPGIRILARAKGLRGTPIDPFRWAEIRRVERRLPGEYRKAIGKVLGKLSAANIDEAVALAELPDQVRGYEDLKLERAATYRQQLADAVRSFG